jgi:hypothetical protein
MNKEKNRLWEIINSNIVIWTLGIIFLTTIPFIWQKCESLKKSNKLKEDRIIKIDNELKSRTEQLKNKINRVIDSTKYSNQTDYYPEVKNILFAFKKAPNETINENVRFDCLYQEFKSQNYISLLYELKELDSDSAKKEEISKMIDIILKDKLIPTKNDLKDSDIHEILSRIDKSLYFEKWK